MILIKRGYFYATLIFVCLVLLGVGAASYRIVGGGELLSLVQKKYHAENFLFYVFLALIVVLTLFFVTLRRSVGVYGELEKVAQLSRHGRYYSGESLRRLGVLGERIDGLFSELNRLNDLKSLKISSLSQLSGFLLENVPLRILVLSRAGIVEKMSRKFIEGYRVDTRSLIGESLADYLNGVRVDEILHKIEKTRTAEILTDVTARFGENDQVISLEFIPLFNSLQGLAGVICAIDKETILTDLSRKAENLSLDVSGVNRRFGDLFRKIRDRSRRR